MSNVETIKVVPARYPLRTVGAVVALFVLAVVIQSVAFNPRWEWSVFARWFFDPVILEGVGQTLLLTLIGTALSVVIGGLLALARLSSSWLLSSLAWGYIWLFRSLPLIVVLIILYNFSYLYDTLSLGVPFTAITWGRFETINVLGQFSTAVVGLTLVQSAYTAEIIRGGFLGWIMVSMKRRRRSVCQPGVARCVSFCRRRYARFCRPDLMKLSVSRKVRPWCMSWRCRNSSIPFR